MSWSPPNRGYTLDANGYPLPSKFDPSEMPEGVPPTFRIVGSSFPVTGSEFSVVDNRSGYQYGYKFPPE
jgi:hypothetical protein